MFNSCIVLDLDETLFHSETSVAPNEKLKKDCDQSFKYMDVYYYVFYRPHLKDFIESIFKNFDHVAIWTAAEKRYATKVVNKIFTPEQKDKLLFFYSRKNCVVNYRGSYTKPLHKVFTSFNFLNFQNTIIVDNTDVSRENPNMSIHIKDFYNDKKDKELLIMQPRKKIDSLRSLRNYKNKHSVKK